MDRYIKIFFFLVMLGVAAKSNGQRWKNDPSYSPHNYKHPNKAAIAKKADTVRIKNIQYASALVPITNNYKAQHLLTKRTVEKVQVMSRPDKNININRNYKQQFAPTSRRRGDQ